MLAMEGLVARISLAGAGSLASPRLDVNLSASDLPGDRL